MTTLTFEHRYQPRGACRELFEDRSPEVLLSGPAGTGKSRACLEKIHLAALANPGMRALLVRKTRVSLADAALQTWKKYVIPESEAVGAVRWYGGSGQEPEQYRYWNGSAVMIGGMDKATKVMSTEYDMIYVQEAIELTEDDWEALTTRLRNGVMSFQQLISDTNPSHPTHWLKARCDTGRTTLLDTLHEDNPVYFDDSGELTESGAAYLRKLDNLTGVRYQRLRRGLWVAAEGIIFEDWEPGVHLINRFPIPESWTRWWTVDFGYTNPFVLQCWAEDSDGRLYRYRELYQTKRTVDLHAKRILREVQDATGGWIEPRPRAVIADHDAEGRATLEKCLGLSTVPAKKTVDDGIQAVMQRMRRAEDGKPRIFLMRDSLIERDGELVEAKKPTCTEEEIPGYVWDGSGKEAPVKENDHGCDGMRYMVAERDLGGRPRVRFM